MIYLATDSILYLCSTSNNLAQKAIKNMLNTKKLDKDLQHIIAKRIEIYQMDYDAPNYDDVEEVLLDLEDDFAEEYGEFLEDALGDVYEKYDINDDVAMCTSYVGRFYQEIKENEEGKVYSIVAKQGFPVEIPELAGHDSYLIFLPNPTRIYLVFGKKAKEVWNFSK